MGKHLVKRHIKKFTYTGEVPHTHVLKVGIEKQARWAYGIYPHVATLLGGVDTVLYPLRRHATVEQHAHTVGIKFLHLVDIMHVLNGHGHHLAHLALDLVTCHTYRAQKILAQLSVDIA